MAEALLSFQLGVMLTVTFKEGAITGSGVTGFNVGSAVVNVDGAFEGTFVGSFEGTAVGTVVGFVVGSAVGTIVGPAVGNVVGFTVVNDL